MKTIVPLSGGIDSAVVLAGCVANGDTILAVTFDYKQPHKVEIQHAIKIAQHYKVPHALIEFPQLGKIDDVFCGRNMCFAAVCISSAQQMGFDRVAFGCNASDWKVFPDCRPEFWRNIERCGESYGVTVLTPLIYMSKSEVVEAARKLNVPIEATWSCYHPQDGKPCHECLACKTREEALK